MSPMAEPLATARLDLIPLRPEDASEMVDVLGDVRLYAFTGGGPPSREELLARYERQSIGRSADRSEVWLNWIIRLRPRGQAIGYVQATVSGSRGPADIAWVIGVPWQGHGFAAEAARAVVSSLERGGVSEITAHVHPSHRASEAVAARAGLEATDEFDDGERVWRKVPVEINESA